MWIPSKATDPASWFLALLHLTKNSSHKTKKQQDPFSAHLWFGSTKRKKKRKKILFYKSQLKSQVFRFLLTPLNAVWRGSVGLGLGSSPTVPAPGKLIPLHVCIHPYPNPNPAPDPELIQWSGSKDRETVSPFSNPNLWIPAKSKRGRQQVRITAKSKHFCVHLSMLLRNNHRSGIVCFLLKS